jgi:hypothetical protein
MAKLDLEDKNVVHVELSVTVMREMIGIDGIPDELNTAIDNAQAPVFNEEEKKAYLVIEITPAK